MNYNKETINKILILLEARRLTIKDICNELKLSRNYVRSHLRYLWSQGSISRIVNNKPMSKVNLPVYSLKTEQEKREQEEEDSFPCASG